MKRCSKGSLCFNPNGGFDTLLFNNEFNKDMQQSKYLRNQCKYCDIKYATKRRIDNPNYSKDYYKNNSQTLIGRFRRIANRANSRHKTNISYKELICLFVSQNGLCPYTNTKLNFKNFHLDHIRSIYVGGNNDYDNLIFTKHVINMGKNGFGVKKYLHEMGELITKEQKEIILNRINNSHNRYEFTIDKFLKMNNDELELTLNDTLMLNN